MEKLKMHSPNLTDENIMKIRDLFPGCVTEAQDEAGKLRYAVDFDQLRQELSDHIVEGPQERYRLDWPGKRDALRTANAPIAKTLRPCREDSVNFDGTQNLFIEGDNLEALKLIQESYLGKVKMIYIDPPYNTGNDFVYNDNYADTADEFLAKSNQISEAKSRLIANTETSGRLHSNWLTFIYPRLKIASNLLHASGVMFISIDDREVHNLRKLCDEIFGESNFVANIVWRSRRSISDDHEVSMNHNHTLVYAKDYSRLKFYGEPLNESEYKNPDDDPRGPWKLVPLDANKPGGNTHYPVTNPNTKEEFWPPKGRSWSLNPQAMNKLIEDNRVAFGLKGDSAPKRKLFLNERIAAGHTRTPSSVLLEGGTTKDGSAEVSALLGGKKIFSYPKPVSFIRKLLQYGINGEDDQIVMDFFAGSGSTAHALIAHAAENGLRKTRFIMVQLPEEVAEKSAAKEAGYENIAEICRERIKRAGDSILQGKFNDRWDKDVGFRAFKVDTSNMAETYYTPNDTSQTNLLGSIESVKPGRADPEDLLFQVLIDWGVDLTLPVSKQSILGKSVFFVNEDPYDLIACFDNGVTEDLVKELAELKPVRVVFRDNGFDSDAVKINVEQIFKQLSPATDVKAI